MNSTKDSISWKYLILQVVIPIFCSAVVTVLISYFSLESVNIRISDSVQTPKGYATVVSIKNYTKKTIDDISLYLSGECNVFSITPEEMYNLSANTVSNIILMPKQDVEVLLYTSQPVGANNLFAQSSSKIKVDYSREPIQNLYTYVIYLFGITISLGISTYFTMKTDKRKRQEGEEELRKELSGIKEELSTIKKKKKTLDQQQEEIRRELSRLEKKRVEMRIFYKLRIKDLSQELNFWKDTIRKLMYMSGTKSINPDIIISTVTKELKTYTVLEKSNDNMDEIFHIANQIAKYKDGNE